MNKEHGLKFTEDILNFSLNAFPKLAVVKSGKYICPMLLSRGTLL